MSPRSYAFLAAVIFTIAAMLQLLRAILGWPVTVDTTWGTVSVPLWPNWIACAVFALLAWLGFAASRT
jgi:hypothetical protein